MKNLNKLTIITICLDVCLIIFLFVVYGPFASFRNWFITTALATGNHKYFANVLYSDNSIIKALQDNLLVEVNEGTDASEIIFDNSPKENYDSIYEQQILERDEGALYKLIILLIG